MPRRGNVPKRDVLPDPLYNSKLVTKLVNSIMLDGKKGTAQTIVYDAFKIMGEKLNMDPLDIFKQVLSISFVKRPVVNRWRFSPRLWKTSCRPWKLRLAV